MAPGSTARKKRGKSGKFAPLIWILTGAAIAFSIVYSAGFVSKCGAGGLNIGTNGGVFSFFQNKSNQTSTSSRSASSTQAASSESGATSSAASSLQGGVAVKIFLAKQTSDSVRFIGKTVTIPGSAAKLKDTLQALINYPTEGDLLNLIPFKTVINKVWIKNRVAYIDFNEDFSVNSYGAMGYKVQIYQIVYTATMFPNIEAVYFYMNGKPLKYLGGDGYIVNNPVYPISSLSIPL